MLFRSFLATGAQRLLEDVNVIAVLSGKYYAKRPKGAKSAKRPRNSATGEVVREYRKAAKRSVKRATVFR